MGRSAVDHQLIPLVQVEAGLRPQPAAGHLQTRLAAFWVLVSAAETNPGRAVLRFTPQPLVVVPFFCSLR